jgi:hypothetical protein
LEGKTPYLEQRSLDQLEQPCLSVLVVRVVPLVRVVLETQEQSPVD